MAFANFEIDVVVGRGNFNDTSAEGFVDEIVSDDGDLSVGKR